jgi:two-component system, response regulator
LQVAKARATGVGFGQGGEEYKVKLTMLRQANDTILLVEDGEAEVLLIQQAVAGCPEKLHLAVSRDAAEALEWLNDTVDRGYAMPRMILLDLKLPKLAGLAVLRTLRMETRLQDVPIVVFSELHEPSDVVLSYQLGANSFVKKPANLVEFSHLLRELADLGWLSGKGLQHSHLQSISG